MLRVPLINPDLSQEESIFRILESVQEFKKVTESIFEKVNGRINILCNDLDQIQKRAEAVQGTILKLQSTNKLITLTAPSRFPSLEYEPTQTIFPVSIGIQLADEENTNVYEPKKPQTNAADIKYILNEKKQFFSPNQLISAQKEHNKVRKVSDKLNSVCNLFFYDSFDVAFDGVEGADLKKKVKKSKSIASKRDLDSDLLPDTTAFGRRVEEDDPFAYKHELAPLQDLDLPDILPDLPDIASDLTLVGFTSDISSSLVEPALPLDSNVDDLSSDFIDLNIGSLTYPPPPPPPPPPLTTPPPPPPPPPPPVPTSVVVLESNVTTVASISTSIPPPPAPPPPPPPPSNLFAPVASPTAVLPAASPSTDNSRNDLMAAIRAAGGSSNARLKSVKKGETKSKPNKEKQALNETSALSKKSDGGDLMSALTNALNARRKAISGNSDKSEAPAKLTGALGRMSDLIPAIPADDDLSTNENDDEDWD